VWCVLCQHGRQEHDGSPNERDGEGRPSSPADPRHRHAACKRRRRERIENRPQRHVVPRDKVALPEEAAKRPRDLASERPPWVASANGRVEHGDLRRPTEHLAVAGQVHPQRSRHR